MGRPRLAPRLVRRDLVCRRRVCGLESQEEMTCRRPSISSWLGPDRLERSSRLVSPRTRNAGCAHRGGQRPPAEELIQPRARRCSQNPETDWMYTAEAGKCGLGLAEGRMMMPRGKMLRRVVGDELHGVRAGHPGDFDAWAEGAPPGGAIATCCRISRRGEALAPSDDISIDAPAPRHRRPPRGFRGAPPILPGAWEFVEAAVAAGIPRARLQRTRPRGPDGVVSLIQTTTPAGKRSSTYRASSRTRPNGGEPHDHHRGARDARRPRGSTRTLGGNGRRVPHRHGRHPHRACRQRGRTERRSDRIAAPAPAVGRRPRRGDRVCGPHVPGRFAARRASTLKTTSRSLSSSPPPARVSR